MASCNYSTGFIKKILEQISADLSTTGFEVDIYAGTQPASSSGIVPSTATLLGTISNGTTGLSFNATADTTVSPPVITKKTTDIWQFTAGAAGTPKWLRIRLRTENGLAADDTALRIDIPFGYGTTGYASFTGDTVVGSIYSINNCGITWVA